MRIAHRWDAINEETNAIENAKLDGKKHIPELLRNGDTKKQLLARSRYLLFKSGEKWTPKQKQRAAVLFELYPDIKKSIFSHTFIKDDILAQQRKRHCAYKNGKVVQRCDRLWIQILQYNISNLLCSLSRDIKLF